MSDKNVFLILIRLDMNEPSPLGMPKFGHHGRLPRMEKGKNYALLAGLLDPSQQTTRAPLTEITLDTDMQGSYNRILDRLESLVERFYDPSDGYVLDPSRLTKREQCSIRDAIGDIGRTIFDLIPAQTPLSAWFEELFRVTGAARSIGNRPEEKHVTIITNDFDIPWYWMKARDYSPTLCEVCSLGMLQLAGRSIGMAVTPPAQPDAKRSSSLRALLIDGMSDSTGCEACAEEEIKVLTELLQGTKDRGRRRSMVFEVDKASSVEDLWRLRKKFPHMLERRVMYRLVHYSGHWSRPDEPTSGLALLDNSLLLNGEALEIDELKDFIESAVLALDGCSSSAGLQAWAEIEGLTTQLLGLGALGCIVSVLPVKNDPIVTEVFWGSLYNDLRSGSVTLGQALAKSRQALKQHFEKGMGSANPAWAFYQLIGNPTVRLVGEGADVDG